MGLFSSKSKVTTENFCTDFYNQWIFSPEIGDMDPWKVICETSYKMIADIDPIFEQVDFSTFLYELRAIRIEVFATVWGHQVNEKLSLEQSEFTKHYLEEREDGNIWESMGNYNQAIARATMTGFPSGSGRERAHITYMNMTRVNFFDKWVELGYDGEAVARVGNRLGSYKAWRAGKGNVFLAFELTRQLECEELDDEARLGMITIIHGFYEGALEAMKKVKII